MTSHSERGRTSQAGANMKAADPVTARPTEPCRAMPACLSDLFGAGTKSATSSHAGCSDAYRSDR